MPPTLRATRGDAPPPAAVVATLRGQIARLGVPWNRWARLRLAELTSQVTTDVGAGLELAEAVERRLGPYHNRLTLIAYSLLLAAVSLNAYLVTKLAASPALAAFVATLGGTLAGALGFQVLARLQAWAKQLSSNGATPAEQLRFNATALAIWRRSQQMKSDLTRDGRNIRKDSWLQLQPRLEKALTFTRDADAAEAVADALIDHRQSFGEVTLDFWLARELSRNVRERGANPRFYARVTAVFQETAAEHGLPLAELDRLLATVLKPETAAVSERASATATA